MRTQFKKKIEKERQKQVEEMAQLLRATAVLPKAIITVNCNTVPENPMAKWDKTPTHIK